LKCTKINSMR